MGWCDLPCPPSTSPGGLYYTAHILPLDQPWVSALPTAVAGEICHLSSAFVDEGSGGARRAGGRRWQAALGEWRWQQGGDPRRVSRTTGGFAVLHYQVDANGTWQSICESHRRLWWGTIINTLPCRGSSAAQRGNVTWPVSLQSVTLL